MTATSTDDDPAPYVWGVTGRAGSRPHLVDLSSFYSDYRGLCRVSVYLVSQFSVPGRVVCAGCRREARRREAS